MGEYEDRYPDAYHGNETPAQSPPGLAPAPRQTREQPLRTAVGAPAAIAENAAPPAWDPVRREMPPLDDDGAAHHAYHEGTYREGAYRGRGPRGYTRSPARIYEDICDRLTEDPFLDAADIDVAVGTAGIVLAGSVDSEDMLQRAEETAREVLGVVRVQNRLTVRPSGPATGATDR